MKKSLLWKGIIVVILLLFIVAGALPSVMSEEKQKTQSVMSIQGFLYVDDDFDSSTPGWQVDHFDKIQDAINIANPNDEIRVYEGFYPENLLVNVNSLTLIGGWDQSGASVIDGSGTGDVVNITASDVTISRFTIQNSGTNDLWPDYDAGIQIWGNNSVITYNNIVNNLAGIWNIYRWTGYNTLISCNTFLDNSRQGIYFDYSDGSVISCNIISNSNTGIGGFKYNDGVISCNNITNQIHDYYGIDFNTCSNNDILCNSIWGYSGSGYGIYLYYGEGENHITGNTIQKMGCAIRMDNTSNPNWLYRNNLIDNIVNAWDNNLRSANNWDVGANGGNYWDDLEDNDCYIPPDYDYCIYTMYGAYNAVDQNPLSAPYNCPYIPSTPTINGPTRARAGEEYYYEFFSEESKCNSLIYIIDWGDNTPFEVTELVEDGIPTTLSHTWSQQGTYTIRAQARSLCGGESGWGTLVVEMPKNKMLTNTLFQWFLEQHPLLFPILRLLIGL